MVYLAPLCAVYQSATPCHRRIEYITRAHVKILLSISSKSKFGKESKLKYIPAIDKDQQYVTTFSPGADQNNYFNM